jgi:colanic acid biosynthesis glycosyl transferase WcaI
VSRILITTQVFYPSHDAISQLLTDLAVGLVEAGVEVHVLTSGVNYMTGEILARHEIHKRVRIWRVPNVRSDKGSLLQRSLSYAAFLTLSGPTMALVPKPDVVFYLSTPPMLGWSAGLAKSLAGIKSVFIAQDVYPEILDKSGHLKNGFAINALAMLDRAVLDKMDRVVVLGERMSEVMQAKGVAPERIRVIENWAPAAGIGTGERKGNELLKRLGIEDKLVVQYSGNMGVVHDMAPILEAAEILKDDDETVFLFIGGGKRRAEVEKRKAGAGLENVMLLPYQPLDELPVSLAAADVSLVSLRPEMEGLVFPSKLYGILASARPVIFIGDENGDIARIVERAECGVSVQTGGQLAKALGELKKNTKELEAMGRRARKYFDENYGRERSIEKYRKLIEELAAK